MNEEIKNRIISLRQSGCSGGALRGSWESRGIRWPRCWRCGNVRVPRGTACPDFPVPSRSEPVAWTSICRRCGASGAVCEHHGGAGVRRASIAGFRRRLQRGETCDPRAASREAAGAGGAFRDRSGGPGAGGRLDLHAGLHRGGTAAGACLRVHPWVFAVPVPGVRRVAGFCHDGPRRRAARSRTWRALPRPASTTIPR